MKLSLDTNDTGYTIRAYEAGRVVINQEVLTRSVIITPDHLIRDWPPQCFADLRAEHLEQLAGLEVEIVLLATGAHLQFPGPSCMAAFASRGIGFEVMDTAAACRTYNILSSEGRSVAAALMMI